MQKVKLVGEISKFGSTWETECSNIRDIFKLIECQTGFRQHLWMEQMLELVMK